jgi:hypothetical protein
MRNFQNDIDKLVSSILNEEIDAKVRKIMETKGSFDDGRDNIDVAEPKGKITAADFKKLRDAKSHKKEVEEFFIDDDFEEEEAEELSQNEPTYVGRGLKDNKIMSKLKNAIRSFNDEDEEELDIETDWSQLEEDMDTEYENDDNDWEEIDLDDETDWSQLEENKMFGSFDDEHGWFDQRDREHSGDFDFDFDEEEFQDFPSLMSKHGEKQRWFGPNDGETFFNKYQEKFGGKPFRVRIPKGLEEDEATEGNAFSGARAKAIEDGEDTFEVDGETYHVKGEHGEGECTECGDKGMYESEDKWIQKTDMKKGALHKKLGIPEGQKIPKSKLNSIKKDLTAKAKGDKKLSAADSKLLKQVNMALTLGGLKESRNTLSLTENELIDMIEMIVKEEMVKDIAEKDNFKVNKPQGLKKTEKAQGESKKENDDYTQEVVKKMKDYMKDMFSGGNGYEENPDDFPQSNYDMEKEHNEMKYHPSDAVEEYIEAFAYPGMTNLVYDEIKPEDKNIEKQIKGDAKNGNAVTGKDGKALGNVSKRSTKVGDRFKKNFDENLYGAEQQKASYKRQSQPVDVAGNAKTNGSLNSKKGSDSSKQGSDKSSSINKATKILNTLESTEDKATKIIKEDLQKMMGLISYDRKTQ